MVDNYDARLNHILDAAEEIERFLSGKNEVEFCNDRLFVVIKRVVGRVKHFHSASLKKRHEHGVIYMPLAIRIPIAQLVSADQWEFF